LPYAPPPRVALSSSYLPPRARDTMCARVTHRDTMRFACCWKHWAHGYAAAVAVVATRRKECAGTVDTGCTERRREGSASPQATRRASRSTRARARLRRCMACLQTRCGPSGSAACQLG
jgi:hypothetical protein